MRETFNPLFGPERGATAAILRKELSAVEAALERAVALGEGLAEENERLRGQVAELIRAMDSETAALVDSAVDCEHLRYMLMYGGGEDPLSTPVGHQGVWTPGRPYLAYSHCWAPGTTCCYHTVKGGAPPGQAPARSALWLRCWPPVVCPIPSLPQDDAREHPLATGMALRQTTWWWDADRAQWSITAGLVGADTYVLSDEHLLNAITWLNEHLGRLWCLEASHRPLLVPCPANAYPDTARWLADLPLYRALQAEKRRRRLRWGPGKKPTSAGGELTWGG